MEVPSLLRDLFSLAPASPNHQNTLNLIEGVYIAFLAKWDR
jgi:hypothetical protein